MIKNLPNSEIEISLSVIWDNWKKHLDQAVREISQEMKIPGFRPGHAPRDLVEKKVGQATILNKAAFLAIEKSYPDFAKKEKLEVIGKPEVTIDRLKEGENLEFKIRVAVMPEIKVKDSYKKEIKTVNENFGKKDFSVKEEEIKLELEKLANSRVKLVTIRREARKNDSLEIDFEVKVDGKLVENGSSKNHALVIGKGVFIPGFEDNLIGTREGEEKEFDLNFPESYFKKDLAGKSGHFKVKVNLVQERQAPEINDEFAASLGNFKDLEALKANLRKGLEHEREHAAQNSRRGEYLKKITQNLEADIPVVLVEEEAKRMMSEFEMQVQSMGMELEKYLEMIKKSREELTGTWKLQAQDRIKGRLALKEIVKLEKLEVGEKEIEEEMNRTLQYYKDVKNAKKNIDLEKLYLYAKDVLENEKVFEMLEKL